MNDHCTLLLDTHKNETFDVFKELVFVVITRS